LRNRINRYGGLLAPIEVGELVSLMASVNYVGNTSLVVGIRVVSEKVKTNSVNHTNTSYFTMVAKDEQNLPTQVPGLILESQLQVRRFVEAIRRKELRHNYRLEVEQIKTPMNYDMYKHLLTTERCKLAVDI
jgi:acyl-CoA hydrolase